VFAHQSYLARNPAPQTAADLTDHVLVGQDRNTGLIGAYEAAGVSLRTNDFGFRCDNDIAEINAVRAGIGIGPLHTGMASKWSEVTQVLPDTPVPPLELWLACHADVRHNKRIRVVMDFLAEKLKTPYAASML